MAAIATLKVHDYLWEIPRSGMMRVPGRIYASEQMMAEMRNDPALIQVANVACLPGIVGYSLAMPDIHMGYGFPIGGVAAVDPDNGVISPGGVGYDINCGVRLIRTKLSYDDVRDKAERMADALFEAIPAGVGSKGAIPGLAMADSSAISDQAYQRGRVQLGTLGSGNHFLECSRVDQIYDSATAQALGLELGQVTILIHSGSRGLGHQTCDDYLKTMGAAMGRYGIQLPDRQLAAVPIKSAEGRAYLGAMAAAANFAWCNRQLIMHLAQRALEAALQLSPRELGFSLIYDVCHNIAKFEQHEVNGERRTLCVHRKGATRAFAPGHPSLPAALRNLGQPVLIPGDMGRYSFLLIGQEGAMKETFGSTCHGAGRVMSRHQAQRTARGRNLYAEMAAAGVVVRSRGRSTIAEEMPAAYKDVADVVGVMEAAGVSRRVARLKPFAVVKG